MGMSLIMSLIFLEILLSICLKFPPKIAVHTEFAPCLKREHERERDAHEVGAKLTGGGHHHPVGVTLCKSQEVHRQYQKGNGEIGEIRGNGGALVLVLVHRSV